MPPPGLYRIDSDTSMNLAPNAVARQRQDGASGDTAARNRVNGKTGGEQLYKGSGPVTHCVKTQVGQGAALPPDFAVAACGKQTTAVVANAIVHTAQCPSGSTKLTIRRLDQASWEYVTEASVRGGGPADLNTLRPMLEQMAKHGANAEERAKAARQLAALPQLQEQTNAKRAETIAQLSKSQANAKTAEEAAALKAALQQLQRGGSPVGGNSRVRWTRIGDSCG